MSTISAYLLTDEEFLDLLDHSDDDDYRFKNFLMDARHKSATRVKIVPKLNPKIPKCLWKKDGF